jgi:uncharacterized membrane protein
MQDRLKELIIIQALVAVAIIALSLFVIPSYGIMGVGYVWLGVQVVFSIVLAFRLTALLKQLSGAREGNLEDVNHI